MSAAMKVLGNSRIVLEQILKFIEMVLKDENDFEISEFYIVQTFLKSRKMVRFFENFKFPGKWERRGSCPSSSPSGNQVDGSPLVAIELFIIFGVFSLR